MKFISRITGFAGLGPLTPRALALLAALLYLLAVPVRLHTDIVSASLACGILGVLAICFLYISFFRLYLRRNLHVELYPPEEMPVSGASTRLVITTSSIRVWPLALLDIALQFKATNAPSVRMRVTGFTERERHLVADVIFPHRGVWALTSIQCSVRDPIELVRYTWKRDLDSAITIVPPLAYQSSLPVLSSSHRPGELVVDNLNRQGDPFDIKPYHPSDGIKRVIWKAFAKRGELLSRHPEASMTPEGYVVIFVLAGPNDDDACSKALAYVRMLKDLRLDVVLGCEGSRNRQPALDEKEAETLLTDSVWDTYTSDTSLLERDLTALLDYCAANTPSASIRKLILFSSSDRIAHHHASIRHLASWLDSRSITPVFCLETSSGMSTSTVPSRSRREGLRQLRSLVIQDEDHNTARSSREQYMAFLSSCAERQWEVYV